MGFHLNYTSQTPSVNTASSGFNPLAPGFTPSSFSTPPGFNGSNSTPQSPFNSSAPKSPFPEFAAQTGFPSSAPQSPFAEYPSQAQFNNQAPGFNPTSPQSFTGQNYGFYTAPRKTKPLSIAIAPGSPLRGQSLSALPRENEKDEMWGPLSAFPGGSSAFSGSFTGASSFTGNGNGNGTIASSFTSGGSVGNGNAFPIGSLDKSFEKMSVGSISNGFSMPPGFKPQKHYFENQPSPLATTFEFGQETFEPPSSPVFRSLNRKRVNDVWQKQMFTPSTSPERSPVKEKGLEEFVESLISPPNSP